MNGDVQERRSRLVEAKVSQLRESVSGARTPFLLALTWCFVWASGLYTHDYGYVKSVLDRFESGAVEGASCECQRGRNFASTIGRYHPALLEADRAAHARADNSATLARVHQNCNSALSDSISELRKEHIQSWNVTVPWLGIRTTIFDFGIVGNAGALLLGLWFYFTSRREHHSIRSFVTEGNDEQESDRWVPYFTSFILRRTKLTGPLDGIDLCYAYESVAHRFVFLTSRRSWLLLVATTAMIVAPAAVSLWNWATDVRDFIGQDFIRELWVRFSVGTTLTFMVVYVGVKCLLQQLKTAALLNAWYLASTNWHEQPNAKCFTIDPLKQTAAPVAVNTVQDGPSL